ncbi:MAG: hypothetical protein ACRECR_03710, partial [Thermoplasmata archaeon]
MSRLLLARIATAVVLLLLLSGAIVGLGLVGPTGAALPPALGAPAAGAALPIARASQINDQPHGDLVVGPDNSPYYLTPAIAGGGVYLQEGNITVLPGGELFVENLTVSFLQFIPSTGNAGQRASHLFNFTVEGLVRFDDSTLTTNTSVLDAFVKLTLNITDGGTFAARSSRLAFPGSVLVSGAGTRFYANDSTIGPNDAVANMFENSTLRADTSYAPVLTESDQAQVVLLQSSWIGYYADDVAGSGAPGVNLSARSSGDIPVNGSLSVDGFFLPAPLASSTALALGYHSFASGYAQFSYLVANGSTLHSAEVNYLGQAYVLPGPFVLPPTRTNTTSSTFVVALPSSLLDAINASGELAFLQASGTYGGPTNLSLELSGANFSTTVTQASLVLAPPLQYNFLVSGGSSFTAADSLLDANWAALPGTPVDAGLSPSEPWQSTKLLLSGGSQAFLANVSVPTPYSTVFDNESIVVPQDSASAAYFYRWAQIQAISGGFGPIPDVRVSAFPAYNVSDPDNATSSLMNDLGVIDPALALYVSAVFASDGDSEALSTSNGFATMLLASSVVSAGTLPTGTFLGSYHLGSELAGGGPNGTVWSYGSVAPYPTDMSPAGSDQLPRAQYPDYRAELAIGAVTTTVDNETSNGSVAIGQEVEFAVPIANIGTAALVNFTANFSFAQPEPFPATALSPQLTFQQLNASKTEIVYFHWVVNETVVGLGGAKNVTFDFGASWNGGGLPVGGTTEQVVPMEVVPAYLSLSFTPPSGALIAGNTYTGQGTVTFAGLGLAQVNLTMISPTGVATPVGTGG